MSSAWWSVSAIWPLLFARSAATTYDRYWPGGGCTFVDRAALAAPRLACASAAAGRRSSASRSRRVVPLVEPCWSRSRRDARNGRGVTPRLSASHETGLVRAMQVQTTAPSLPPINLGTSACRNIAKHFSAIRWHGCHANCHANPSYDGHAADISPNRTANSIAAAGTAWRTATARVVCHGMRAVGSLIETGMVVRTQ